MHDPDDVGNGETLPHDDTEHTLPVPAPNQDSDPSVRLETLRSHSSSDRYQMRTRVGRGGQGAIYEVWDEDLRRRLAMKVVLGKENTASATDTPPANPESLSRFLEEAQITGQLDHPGVVPVHELGLDDAGQVYFTMRLVKGDNLHEIFAKVHQGSEGWTQLRALGAVLKACEALAYAHSKKVIHRDLKPSNLMVGKYGEVYVMDWGLARVLGQEDAHDLRMKDAAPTSSLKTDRRTFRDADLDSPLETMDGRVLGTPSYMPPEQAKGNIDEMGPASDVYSMGAVIYQLLTGHVPFVPTDGQISQRTILARVLDGAPPRITTLAPEAPPELVAICEKAMSREMTDRYSDMDALAIDLRAFLEGRVVTAFESGPWAEMRKWVARNKGWATTVVAAFVFLIVGLGWALLERGRANDEAWRAGQAAEAERTAKLEAQDSARREREAKEEAIASQKLAEQREKEAEAARAAETKRAEELVLVTRFQEEQLSKIDVPLMAARLSQQIVEGVRDAADRANAGAESTEERIAQLKKLLAGSDYVGLALSTLEDNVFNRALSAIEEQFADQPLVQARLYHSIAVTLRRVGLLESATKPQQQAVEIWRSNLGNDHKTTLMGVSAMGKLLLAQGELDDAERLFREALDGRRRALGPEHKNTLTSLTNLGTVLHNRGKLEDAKAHLTEALETQRRVLGSDNPATLTTLNNMATLLITQGKYSEAERYIREDLEGSRRILGPTHPDTLVSLNSLGGLLWEQSRYDEAEPYFREALAARVATLGEDHPDTLESVNNLASVLEGQGKLEEATALFSEALPRCREVLGNEHTMTLTLISNLNSSLLRQKKYKEALPYAREALETAERVLGPNHMQTAGMLNNYAALLRRTGQLAEAESYLRRTLDIVQKLVGDNHPRVFIVLESLASVVQDLGRHGDAEPMFRRVLAGNRKAYGDQHSYTLKSLADLGIVLRKTGKLTESETLLAEAVGTSKRLKQTEHWRFGVFLSEYGLTLHALGRHAEAAAALKEATELFATTLGLESARGRGAARNLIACLEALHAANPGAGHDTAAAEWRAKLEAVEGGTTTPADSG